MDDPSLDEAEHLRALNGLKKINRISLAAASIYEPIIRLAQRDNLKSLRLLDVACGGGDVAAAVAQKLQRVGIQVHLTLLDRSDVALRQAARTAEILGVNASVVCQDALAALPVDNFDIITNSLFLHHLERQQVIDVLRHMRHAAGRAVIISDLVRSRLGWALAWAGCRILSRSPVVHYDGPVSVQGAWTPRELQEMAIEAEMSGIRIAFRWPCRVLLEWYRDDKRESAT